MKSDEKFQKEKLDFEESLKKEKKEYEENLKKDKLAFELLRKKDKTELEEKNKIERLKLLADLEKARKDISLVEQQKLELGKKFEKDLNVKVDENAKFLTKIKIIEQEAGLSKIENGKMVEQLVVMNKKILDLQSTNIKLQTQANESSNKNSKRDEECDVLNQKLLDLQSKFDTIVAEFEVRQASLERSTKNLIEKEENNKKLKIRNEELQQSESQLKRVATRFEKERDELITKNQCLDSKLNDAQIMSLNRSKELAQIKEDIASYIDKYEVLNRNNDMLLKKSAEAENEFKISERKSTQIV
ncbi:hypothetical protein HK096_001090 [Nowakowskiella sp. JEL0078]|nr:hypothetical protein HK096_001090 [Nowakowskiella sp. JEL0078]